MDPDDHRPAVRDPGGDQVMSTSPIDTAADAAARDAMHRWSARWPTTRPRSAPLRRVGDQRTDAGVGRRGGGDGPGRARPRALDLPGAEGAWCAALVRRRPVRRRAPAGAARRRAARLDVDDRRQPARRRRPDDVRRRLCGFERAADGPAGAQDPAGGGLAPGPRRGVGQTAVPLRRAPDVSCWSRA